MRKPKPKPYYDVSIYPNGQWSVTFVPMSDKNDSLLARGREYSVELAERKANAHIEADKRNRADRAKRAEEFADGSKHYRVKA